MTGFAVGAGGVRRAELCGHPIPAVDGALELFRLALPYPDYPRSPNLSLNGRGSRWEVNTAVQSVRADVARLARFRGIRPGRHVVVHLAWRPRKPAGQDAENLVGLFKACCDGLARGPRRPTQKNPGMAIGLDLVPDDVPQYMTKLIPAILPPDPVEGPGMWLTVGVAR